MAVSGRRCWQTALLKHRDRLNASLGWMRELRVLAKRPWQMIQVTKAGSSPSSAASGGIPGGIPGHLWKLWESVNWSVHTSSHSNWEILKEEANLIYHQPSWSQFTTLEILEQLHKLRNTLIFISHVWLYGGCFRLWTIQNHNLLSIINVNIHFN